ncbi:chitin deacetylase [Mortierella sp. GBA30]|nr:chitin deacetylase [Mortierella sp. GBA30]
MVKLFATSLTIVVLSLAVVKAQEPIVIANYPKINEIPPVTSPEVVAWLKEIDLSGAPNIPLRVGAPPACPAAPAADDSPNTWGVTYDDGPSQFTPTLLDFLKTNKISASFFLIGSNVIQYPDIVKREVAEGHHLASHTWSHHALTTLTNEQIVAEMKWTEKAVMAATGLRLKYMRPPYGDINNRVRFVLKKLGYIPVDWTGDQFDTNDWRQPTWTEASVISNFTKSLDDYVKTPKTKGFYCLEHDVNQLDVNVAQKLIPLGQARKINFASVAGCENDAQPYQAGGTAPMPTLPGTKPTGSAGAGTPTGANGSGPSVIGGKNGTSGAGQLAATSFVSALAAVVAGAILA